MSTDLLKLYKLSTPACNSLNLFEVYEHMMVNYNISILIIFFINFASTNLQMASIFYFLFLSMHYM